MTLLNLINVEANYGVVRALRGVSLTIEEGAVVALLGANGAGKSTTLKCISGVVEARAGTIEFQGRCLNGLSPEQIVRLGIAQVPEGRKIFKDLTVLENLRMGAYVRSDRKEIARDLEFVYSLFPRLTERSGQPGGALSGGEQQMLAIGRAFMARPKLLLLDEPSLGLAPLIISNIFETLLSVNREQGTALLVVEQNARIALKNARFGYVMQLGRIVVKGPSETLRQEGEVLKSYLGTQS
jgi:branched-chain amino acid transport system ATP-binding protein